MRVLKKFLFEFVMFGSCIVQTSKITGRLVFSSVTHDDPPFFLMFFVNARD
ncbi:hypothetical protein T4A_4831 [Trichinella pseudospiralis]|uniref:Uncharacterized protein n=1 Tax=Trichinella pseudospiralis TaxID=6337 RepID=A0A0V1DR51_TRIPS|nr:hypothetical protein T4A_4831 [Trichinella pseudospiralis]